MGGTASPGPAHSVKEGYARPQPTTIISMPHSATSAGPIIVAEFDAIDKAQPQQRSTHVHPSVSGINPSGLPR